MKNLFLLLVAAVGITTASSCAKCVTCKKGDEKLKVCDKDWTSQDQSDRIDVLEATGYDCKATTGAY